MSSSRSHRSTVAVLGTALVAVLALVLGGAPAVADRSTTSGKHPVPGDQPLRGYTISNPPLAPLTVYGGQTRVVQGVLDHAAYDVEVPPSWNGELVMWAHGYRGTGKVLTVDPPGYGLREKLVKQGYAWAASSYATNDYNVATGVTTTHSLAGYVGRLLRHKPSRVYIAGISMGGHVIGRSLEDYPRFYDGALPMCGVLGDQELFDYFLSYNLVAQDLAGRKVSPPTADYLSTDVPFIEQKLGLVGLAPGGPDTTNALGKQLRAITTNLTGGPRPGSDQAFALWKDFPFTLYTPDNGGPLRENAGRVAQNADTVYAPNTPVDVNATVQRVTETARSIRRTSRLTEIPRIKGRPHVPTLTLHGLGDLFVPFSMEQIYAREVAAHHRSTLLVQRAIREAGHCEFTPTEVGTAWDDLTRWVESRASHKRDEVLRPVGDDVRTAATVASPTYGCRFTDPTAYQSPALFPTRALYPRCPRS